MVTQKSRFNFFFLTDMFINCLDLLSLCSSDILSICEQFSHLYLQAATQNFFITHFNLSINQFEVGQSDIKSGSHSVSHFMFSHCESVGYFMFNICQSVSQSVSHLCSVTVSQSVSHLCSVIVSQSVSYFMFSHCQSVSESFMFLIICQSVSQWVIYVPHHLSVSESVSHLCSSFVCQWVSESVTHFMFSICQSVSHFMFSHCQSVSESFMFLVICQSVSQWVIYVPHHLSVSESVSHICSSFVCQWVSEAFYVQYLSVSESFYVQYLSVSRLVILCSVSVCQSVSQSVILCSVSFS